MNSDGWTLVGLSLVILYAFLLVLKTFGLLTISWWWFVLIWGPFAVILGVIVFVIGFGISFLLLLGFIGLFDVLKSKRII